MYNCWKSSYSNQGITGDLIMKKKIGIIGQFPPPIHGLSKSLDTLYNSYLNKEFNFIKIDLSNNKKFLKNLFKILFSKIDLYYLTISQSKFGNIRDLIIIKLVQVKKRKIVIHLHGGGFRSVLDNELGKYQRNLNYKILSNVDAGIVLGDSLRYIFEGIIPKDRIYIVKNCVDNEFIISDEDFNKKMLDLENKREFNILYLSNFIEDKGYKEVLELAKLVKEKNDMRFKFIFAGKFFDEDDKKNYFEFINNNNLNNIIEYRGIVDGEDKKKLLKKSDIFILLTRYKNEGQPIAIIEAVVNGIRVISTDHSGIIDILNEKEMIMIDKSNINVENIYKKIINKYENIYKEAKELNYNREKIRKEFSEENYLESLEKIFLEMIRD